MLKKCLLSLILLFGAALLSLNAQSDGFFKNGDSNDYNDRDGLAYNITLGGVQNNETPGAPLGSGLLIMVAAGAGYVMVRRRISARKGMTTLLVFALLFGMTQCKKNVVTPITPSDNGIQITLDADCGGDKTVFNYDGTFSWSNTTEYINVGGKVSGYLGQLTGVGDGESSSIAFSGTIAEPAADETMLYFFYLGNGDHAGATSLDFSQQDGEQEDVTNWHIAIGQAEYTGGGSYNVTLNMAMAIAYLDLRGFFIEDQDDETIYVYGDDVYTTASIDYNNGTIKGNSKGFINVGTPSSKKIAFIPTGTTSTIVNFVSNSKKGSVEFPNGIRPATYYSGNGYSYDVHVVAGDGIPGTFSVSATKKVFFSQGNLQYQASTNTWRFAENQYDAIGNNAGNNNFSETRSTQSDWIDLFGWGTSGWNSDKANTYYRPYDYIGTGSSSSGYGYGPRHKEGYSWIYNSDNLTGDCANSDWGVYNIISNGGSGWRTLTGGDEDGAEWKYLLETRSASTVAGTANARYFKAVVNNVNGLIILPDVYIHPDVAAPKNINTSYAAWANVSTYNDNDWKTMETAGAVFLPIDGYRSYSNNQPQYSSGTGYYWSSTVYNNTSAYSISIGTSLNLKNTGAKRLGYAVRLVKDVD